MSAETVAGRFRRPFVDSPAITIPTAIAAWIPLVAGVVAILAGAWMLGGTFFGDPTIYLVYARNAAEGHLFQFNPGTFSSGVASPLWSLVLALPFMIGAGVAGAKIWTAIWAVSALLATTYAVRRLTGSTFAATVGAAVVVPGLAYYGVMTYDAGMTVTLVALSLVARGRGLAAIWALMLFDRPELAVIIGFEMLALGWRRYLLLAAVAGIPAVIYDGYSQLTLGSYSVSNVARTIDNGEMAIRYGPLLVSGRAIDYLIGLAPLAVLAVLGVMRGRRHALVVAGVLAVFTAILILYPVTQYVQRYALAAMPMLGLGVGLALARVRFASVVVVAVVGMATIGSLVTASTAGQHGYTFDTITERAVVERLNALAPPNSTVIGYEVQDRWYLRPDLRYLSVNGLTDGLITPWRERGDIAGYLTTHCPRIWIANDQNFGVPYYRGTILETAYRALLAGSEQIELEGIIFTVVDRPPPPIGGFAGARMLIRLDSAACPA
ncbi:MAG TPA: hypothetical protein VJ850_09380 [Candidatus Limnocylindrales bacterium]|nr:hypothetical protein [Candidatus Limnocylindrales bacterium]